MKNQGQLVRLPVVRENVGKSLLAYYKLNAHWFREYPLERIEREGLFRIDGRPVASAHELQAAEALGFFRPPWVEPPFLGEIALIFEDDELYVVEKPVGIPITPTGLFFENSLLHIARKRSGIAALSPLHRLDLETSGVFAFCKQPQARGFYQKQFQMQQVEKKYLALVFGAFSKEITRIDLPILPDPAQRTRFKADQGQAGKAAVTLVECLESWPGYSLLMLQPLSGRTNQIRVHLAALGHPIVGDKKYQADPQIYRNWCEQRDLSQIIDRIELPNQALHHQEMRLATRASKLCLRSLTQPAWMQMRGAMG